jgi:hypothetical protein
VVGSLCEQSTELEWGQGDRGYHLEYRVQTFSKISFKLKFYEEYMSIPILFLFYHIENCTLNNYNICILILKWLSWNSADENVSNTIRPIWDEAHQRLLQFMKHAQGLSL